VVYWRNLARSAILFSLGNLVFFLITCGQFSTLTLVSSFFLILIAACFLYVQYHKIRGLPNPFIANIQQTDFVIPKEQTQAHVETVVRVIESIRSVLQDVLSCDDMKLTLQAVAIAIAALFIGNVFSDVSLLYLLFLISFLWPRLYEEKRNQIDNAVTTAVTQVREKLKPVNTTVTQVREKMKPLFDKIPKPKTN